MIDYTVTQLIADLKRRGSFPDSQNLFTNSDIVDFMNDCQRMKLTPQVMATREELLVVSTSTPLVADQTDYTIPVRALGNKVRYIYLQDINNTSNLTQLPRLAPENRAGFESFVSSGGGASGYYFRDNKIILNNKPTSNENRNLVIEYFRRPNRLTLEANAGLITAIVGNVITVQLAPSTWTATTVLDAIGGNSPFVSLSDDIAITISGNSITVSTAVAATLSVGDYLAESGYTPIPQYTEELHPILVQYALIKIYEAQADMTSAEMALLELSKLEKTVYAMISPRDEGQSKTLTSNNNIFRQGYNRY